MFLYELAIEIGERSSDVCQKAESIGLGPLLSTSELTREQVAALRAAYNRPLPGGAPGSAGAAPSVWGAPPATPIEAPGRPPSKIGQVAALGLVVAVVLAGFAYMFVNAGPDEERQQAISEDLAAWSDAPPVTIDPEVAAAAAADVPSDEPTGETELCAAQDAMYDAEMRMHPDRQGVNDADLAIWRTAVDDMIRWGPADAADEITWYRDANLAYYDATTRMSMGKARPYFDEVKRAEDRMYPQIIPFCGYPGD